MESNSKKLVIQFFKVHHSKKKKSLFFLKERLVSLVNEK